VNYYLVIYRRRAGEADVRDFGPDRSAALRARFALERSSEVNGDTEVVVLGARSRSALERTHARYFELGKGFAEGNPQRSALSP
jgi:hypothetical protein